MSSLNIEKDENGNVLLTKYNNDNGTILHTGSLKECISMLKNYIKNKHRTVLYCYYDESDHVHDKTNEEIKKIPGKEFCEL